MTYRELKQFTEIVRVLGYQHPVGIDSFDTPNFGLMANLLHWLATLYDPDIVVLAELSNEHGRVEFVRGIVQQMATKSGIRLNPRKLYASDRGAVRELLKIATPMYRGISNTQGTTHTSKQEPLPKNANVKKISTLSASVPKHAVELFDQLDKEVQIRETRTKILSTVPSLDEVEKAVYAAVDGASTRLDTLNKEIDRLNADEDSLNAKIKQRKYDYDRQSKRLMSVQTIRPAYMDEYELHEQELQELFKVYFQHYRNVDYFEKQLQEIEERLAANRAKQIKLQQEHGAKETKEMINQVKGSFKIGPSTGLDLGLASGDDGDMASNLLDNSDDGF